MPTVVDRPGLWQWPDAMALRWPYAGPVLREPPAAEVAVDTALVRHLLRSQHPDLAALPLRPIGAGWDNVMFRLGRQLCVRMPRRALGARLIVKEARWVPVLAGRLPLPVPAPQRLGEPDERYPWPWTVCSYVPGRPVGAAGLVGPTGRRAADDLAAFLDALHVPAPAGAPTNALRGVPLERRAEAVERALGALPGQLARLIERTWARAVDCPAHPGPPRWLHGDLHNQNILARRGRITGVIDFGDLSAGDPSTDLAVAWLVLDAAGRSRLRQRMAPDDDAWQRALGWAAYFGLMFAEHSRTAPQNAAIGRRTLGEVAASVR